MANSDKQSKKKRQIKPSMRDLADNKKPGRGRRLKSANSVVKRPFNKVRDLLRKEYHPIKLPDNKTGKVLTKKRSLIPAYLRDSWGEIKKVTWPNRRETIRLTIAVFIFSAIFATFVASLDFVLDKIFRRLIAG